MITVHEEYLIDEAGNRKAVVLPLAAWPMSRDPAESRRLGRFLKMMEIFNRLQCRQDFLAAFELIPLKMSAVA